MNSSIRSYFLPVLWGFPSLSSDFLMGVYCVRLDHRYSGEQLEKLDKKFPLA